jgi:hypothetical protein
MSIQSPIEELIEVKHGNLFIKNIKGLFVAGKNIIRKNGTLRLIFKSEIANRVDGEMWLEGTDLKIKINGVTYSINKT